MNISPIPLVHANVARNASSISETPVNSGARADAGARRRSQPEGMPPLRGAGRADSPNAEPQQVLANDFPFELHAEVARHVLDGTSNRDIASICRTAEAYDTAMPRPEKGHEHHWRDWLNPTQRESLSALKQFCNEAEAYVKSVVRANHVSFILACRLLPWISPEARSRLVEILVASPCINVEEGAPLERRASSEGLREVFRHHALLDEKAKDDVINWLNRACTTAELTVAQRFALDGLLTLPSPGEPFCNYELAMRIGDFEQHLQHSTNDWPPVAHWALHLRSAARHEIVRSAFTQDGIRISDELVVLFSDMDEAHREALVSELVSRGDQEAGMWLSSIAAQSGLLSQKAKDLILGWTASGANQIYWMIVRRVRPLFSAQQKDAKFEESLVGHALTHGDSAQKLWALVHCCESLRETLDAGFLRGLCEVFDNFESTDIINIPRRWDDDAEDEVPIALWAEVGCALYRKLSEPEKTRFRGRVAQLVSAQSQSLSPVLAGLATHLLELEKDFTKNLLCRVLEPNRTALGGSDIAKFYGGIRPHFSRLEPEFQKGLREHMRSRSVVEWVYSGRGSDALFEALVNTV